MICKNCGYDNDDSAIFCKGCNKILKRKGGINLAEQTLNSENKEANIEKEIVEEPTSNIGNEVIRDYQTINSTVNNNKKKSFSSSNIKYIAIACSLLFVFLIVKTVMSGSENEDDVSFDTTVEEGYQDETSAEEDVQQEEYTDDTTYEDESYASSSFGDISDNNYEDTSYYQRPGDFVLVNEGSYSFAYPKNYYSVVKRTEYGYYFGANNGTYFDISVTDVYFEEYELTEVMDQYHSDAMYTLYNSESIIYNDDESYPYRRSIVKGYEDYDESILVYVLCNVYTDRIERYVFTVPAGYTEREEQYAEYMMDCVYRYCSFSGSSYKPRTFNQFINGNVGSKK